MAKLTKKLEDLSAFSIDELIAKCDPTEQLVIAGLLDNAGRLDQNQVAAKLGLSKHQVYGCLRREGQAVLSELLRRAIYASYASHQAQLDTLLALELRLIESGTRNDLVKLAALHKRLERIEKAAFRPTQTSQDESDQDEAELLRQAAEYPDKR